MTTSLARQTPFSLVAAVCPYGKAFGKLFRDDGEQVELRKFITVDYEMEACYYYHLNLLQQLLLTILLSQVGASSEFAGIFKATVVVNTYPEESDLALNTIVVAGLMVRSEPIHERHC